MSDNCGDDLKFELGNWEFDSNTANNFDAHVEKSIPGYHQSHDLISILSDHFLVDNDFLVDIGCSTGTVLHKIAKRHSGKNIDILGIDESERMIELASANNTDPRINFLCDSFMSVDLHRKVDVFLLVYVLQFVRPKIRQDFVNRLYENLNWGGCLMLFEKSRGSDSRFNDIFNSAYWEWKLLQGFSASEIFSKARSLRGVMEPFTINGTMGLLKRAGFQDIEICFKWGPFQGILAIK